MSRLSDAELHALAAMVQADAVDIECENKHMIAIQESISRTNQGLMPHYSLRSVADCDSYKKLVAELQCRQVM